MMGFKGHIVGKMLCVYNHPRVDPFGITYTYERLTIHNEYLCRTSTESAFFNVYDLISDEYLCKAPVDYFLPEHIVRMYKLKNILNDSNETLQDFSKSLYSDLNKSLQWNYWK